MNSDQNQPKKPRSKKAVKVIAAASAAALVLIVGAIVLILSMAGVLHFGGQSEAAASTMLRDVPGVEKVYLGTNSSYSGFIKQTFLGAHLTLKSGTVIKDLPAVLEYVIAVTWSDNHLKPNQAVSVGVSIDGTAVPGQLAAVKSLGWTSARMLNLNLTDANVYLNLDEVQTKLGSWPGKVPSALKI